VRNGWVAVSGWAAARWDPLALGWEVKTPAPGSWVPSGSAEVGGGAAADGAWVVLWSSVIMMELVRA
jgi:hypothetical protein